LGGRAAYAGCYASASGDCTACDHYGSGTNQRTERYRASCASADSKHGSGKSKYNAAYKYDRPADANNN